LDAEAWIMNGKARIKFIPQPTQLASAPSYEDGRSLTPSEVSMRLPTPNKMKNFQSLYSLQVRYLLSTENQIVKGLQSMIEQATDTHLKQAFQSHLQETEIHVTRLKDILARINDGDADNTKDPIATALVGSGLNIVKKSEAGAVRDAGLIATAQKIEHYEITSYGRARDWAKLLGQNDDMALLQKTLDEEKHADELLSSISERATSSVVAA
jgi:ferritin-like metal-binding protein YciE